MRSIRHCLSLFVLTVMVSGCVTNPSTGRSQFIIVPPDKTAAMGAEAAPQLVQEYGGEVESQALRAYVRSVGEKLVEHVEPEYEQIQWEFYTLDADVINAFALPGGKIFITRGLLDQFENEAQVAGVLGHEIGHVTARHIDERLSQTLTAQLGLEVVNQAVGSGDPTLTTQLIQVGSQLLAQGTLLTFSRKQESESDEQGLKYMTAAGYDAQGMLQVLQVLKEAAQGPSMPEFLSTHPLPDTRLREVKELIDDEYGYAKDSPEYDLHRARFQQEAEPHL